MSDPTGKQVNPTKVYQEAGEKAGTAARQKDSARARFHSEWVSRAIMLEPVELRSELRKAFEESYRESYRTY